MRMISVNMIKSTAVSAFKGKAVSPALVKKDEGRRSYF